MASTTPSPLSQLKMLARALMAVPLVLAVVSASRSRGHWPRSPSSDSPSRSPCRRPATEYGP